MSLRPHEYVGSAQAPYEFELALKAGDQIEGAAAPFPPLTVLSATVGPATLQYQTLTVRAGDEEGGSDVLVGRLVAVLASGAEIEVQREALPADVENPEVDTSKCAACGGPLRTGDVLVRSGAAYHGRCWED